MDGDSDDEDEEERRKGATTPGGRASLYEAPREAKLSLLSSSSAGGGGGGGRGADTDSSALEPRGAGLGGDDDARGAVGLVEVAVSAEARLANIERTEAAKRRAREEAAGGGGSSSLRGHVFASSSSFGGTGRGVGGVVEGFRRGDLPASFGGGKKAVRR